MQKMMLMLMGLVMLFRAMIERLQWRLATAGIPGFMAPLCLFEMTPEEQKEFETLKAEAEAAKAKLAEYEKAKFSDTPPASPKKEDDPTVLEAIRKKEREEAEKAEKEKRILEGAKFIATFDGLIKDGGDFFPKEVTAALDVISKKKYDNELQRADDLRASIAESVFSVQKNLDLLPELGKSKVKDFLTLSQSAKEKQSAAIWEYVLAALDTHKRFEKQARTEAARRGLATPSGATAEYENKIFGLRKEQAKNK